MMADDWRRRSSDREIGELAGNVAALVREIDRDRKIRDEQHEKNTDKLDQVLGLKPMVDEHEEWIETEGKPTARIVRNARATSKGMIIGATLGGGAVGAFVVKLVTALAAAMH